MFGVLMRPPARVRIGHRWVETWRACAVGGVVAGGMTLMLLTAATGGSVLLALALVPLLVAGFVVSSLVRRRLLGRETKVLLEQLFVAIGVASSVIWLAGEPMVRWLDRVVPSLAVLFAFGRIGCTAAGCCHGVPSSFGVGPPAKRRFPTQPIEACAWVVLASVGGAVAVVGPEGAAAAAVLAAYGLFRFAIEGVRGDRRPMLGPLSESQWLSGLAFAVAIAVGPSRDLELAAIGVVIVSALGAAGLWTTRHRWLEPSRVVEFEAPLTRWAKGVAVGALGGDEVRTDTVGLLSLATSASDGQVVLSAMSVTAEPLVSGQARMAFEALAEAWSVEVPEMVEAKPGLFAATFQVGGTPSAVTPTVDRSSQPRPTAYFGG